MISFIRIDDRIIHGQVVTRWATEYPCDGILAVNDEAAKNEVLKSALKSASTKRTLIYTTEEFEKKIKEAVASDKQYFLITKDPFTMKKLLVDGDIKLSVPIIVGPQSARPGTLNVGRNADILPDEVLEFEALHNFGYDIQFKLVPDSKPVIWKNVREDLLQKCN